MHAVWKFCHPCYAAARLPYLNEPDRCQRSHCQLPPCPLHRCMHASTHSCRARAQACARPALNPDSALATCSLQLQTTAICGWQRNTQ